MTMRALSTEFCSDHFVYGGCTCLRRRRMIDGLQFFDDNADSLYGQLGRLAQAWRVVLGIVHIYGSLFGKVYNWTFVIF